jgi:hypothetical protein
MEDSMNERTSYRGPRSDSMKFMDELNHAFPDCQFEVEKDKSVWVFGYPTGVVYDDTQSFKNNVEFAVKKIHEFLIISV